ncbi:MAG: PBP1A family penicillin-binding protein [Gemmatimonadetes bacterium]|nr:PBP1A family penicillin-binding protein [Gemmatimonadota bacterium]
MAWKPARWTPRGLTLAAGVIASSLAGLSLTLAGAALRWAAVPSCAGGDCPVLGEVVEFRPYQPPAVHDASGTVVAYLPGRVSAWTDLANLSPWLVEGVVAVEDRRFREHRGVDHRGILRAAVRNVRSGQTREGASTLTMQLVRVLWVDGLQGYSKWRRKAVELRAARALERELTKDQILEFYLNSVYMGTGVYGVEAASWDYFGKPASELELWEAASLVGTIKTPARYNPRGGEPARQRRDLVLEVMEREGVVSSAEAAEALQQPMRFLEEGPDHQAGSYFASAVDRELRRLVPDPARRSGARVFTTLDRRAQASAEARLAEQIRRLKAQAAEGAADADDGDRERPLQGALVMVEMETGAIRAVVGGRSFDESEYNRATQARRQPGSAFKPIVFGAALEAQTLTLADRIDLSPVRMETDEGLWEPKDLVEDTTGMPARFALARSSNTAAIRIGMAAGLPAVRDFARRLGVQSPIAPYPSTLLGASELTPLELAAAYAVIGNGGLAVDPYLIERIEFPGGQPAWQRETEPRRAIQPEVAFLVHSALVDVVNRGTGYSIRREGYQGPAAGKTGTTNEGYDAWFVGYDGRLSAAVWIGFDQPRAIVKEATGGGIAAPVWARVMMDLAGPSGSPARWRRPPGLSEVLVDESMGFRVPDGCESTRPARMELFLVGTEPVSFCPDFELRTDLNVPLVAPPVETSGVTNLSTVDPENSTVDPEKSS